MGIHVLVDLPFSSMERTVPRSHAHAIFSEHVFLCHPNVSQIQLDEPMGPSPRSNVLQDVKSVVTRDGGPISDVAGGKPVPQEPSTSPGAALEAFQRLLEEFADALSTTKRDEQRTLCAVHVGVQASGARSEGLEKRKGSGLFSQHRVTANSIWVLSRCCVSGLLICCPELVSINDFASSL